MFMPERIRQLMLDRLFAEGLATAHKEPGYANIYRIEFDSNPNAPYNETVTWYEFSDECEQFSQGYFLSAEAAQRMLVRYCEEML